ncbi:MAG: hypothetical protein ACK5PP_16120 [Acidimicrobiales bacterium]
MWFERLVGFNESTADAVRSRIRVDGDRMISRVNGRELGCGRLELPSLAELRQRTDALVEAPVPSRLRETVGDAADLHRDPGNAGAVFQAASQFNLLEMVSPEVEPEAGVDGYENDRTQGPACAVACGAGTIYRNYFVDVDGRPGQTRSAQLDTLADVGELLVPGGPAPWTMRNGYALFDRVGLERVNDRLGAMSPGELDLVRAHLRVGVHHQVEVTSSATGHLVTQVYCSALPVAYSRQPVGRFEPLARLVLDGAYEATLRAAALNAARTGNRTVYLTLVGGGVFGNEESWIIDAMERAFGTTADAGLDIVVVSHRRSNPAVTALAGRI